MFKLVETGGRRWSYLPYHKRSDGRNDVAAIKDILVGQTIHKIPSARNDDHNGQLFAPERLAARQRNQRGIERNEPDKVDGRHGLSPPRPVGISETSHTPRLEIVDHRIGRGV